jgi:HK97 family phage major capsid protein
MLQNIKKSFTTPRAVALMLLGAVACAAQAMGVDVIAFAQANPAIGLLAMTGEMDVKDIKGALDKITDQVKEAGEKALAEAQKGIKMSEAQKEQVDTLLTGQAELKAQLLEVEQKQAKRAENETPHLKSIGYQVIEGKGFKEKLDSFRQQRKGSMSVEVKAITSASGSAGQGVYPEYLPGVTLMPNRRLTVRDLMSPGRTSSNLIRYLKETGWTNSAGPTAEGTRKNESDIDYALTDASVKKLTHFIKASTEILDDMPALQSQIDARLMYGLKLVEENQLLKGAGTGNNLNGIYTQATAYSAPIVVASATKIDTLRLMLLQAELAEYYADGIVLHPSEWAAIELLKDTQGRYLIGNPQGTLQPTLWGRSVVATQAMTVDTALVGAFKMASQIFDREDAAIVIATENEDDFVNNLVTIMAEERLTSVVYRPEAFVKNTNFDGSV